jgi:hypothetical protein
MAVTATRMKECVQVLDQSNYYNVHEVSCPTGELWQHVSICALKEPHLE